MGPRDRRISDIIAVEEALIRRRHVIYVEGYDPQGAEGYYSLFERAWKRFLTIWPLKARLGKLALDSQDFAHWDVEASGPNWQVATRYDFLRQEHIIRANMAQPLWQQIPRALGWGLDYLVSGAIFRVLRASWAFGLVLIHFQLLLTWWLALSIGSGVLAALAVTRLLDWPAVVGFLVGLVVALGAFCALKPLANRWFAIQINSHWPYLCAFARGEPTCFDAPIEACAERIVAAARANEVDEIVVIGHSGGGALAPAVMARALELDPDLGRRGPSVVLLTLGSIAPGAALHPKAVKLRAVFAGLAVEPSIRWIDAQSRKDVLNFWDFDPIAEIGIRIGAERCNPLVWQVRFRDVLTEELYRRIRFNFFRLHYQFIMANDRREPAKMGYDYFMLVCGPLAVATWAADPARALAAFAADATLVEDGAAVTSPTTARSPPAESARSSSSR
jgi:pimeloyl-ACP methyl ester carboxylesterase